MTGEIDIFPKTQWIEWKIKDFSFSEAQEKPYSSPEFSLLGESWNLMLYLDASNCCDLSEYNHSLYLIRNSSGPTIHMEVSVAIKTLNGAKVMEKHCRKDFDPNISNELAILQFITKSELASQWSELVPSGTLTLICSMTMLASDENTGGVADPLELLSLVESTAIPVPSGENNKLSKQHEIKTIDSMEPVVSVNSLPPEIILKIFSYLTQNELCRISRKWNEFTKSPVLWKEVDVKFFSRDTDMNENISSFAGKLPFNVTHLQLDFSESSYIVRLNFEEFCIRLSEKCPNLHRLYLHEARLSVNLSSVINLCGKFLSNLKVLTLFQVSFDKRDRGSEHDGSSKIDILDISFCRKVQRSYLHCFSKMPCLKKLSLRDVRVGGRYDLPVDENDVSFLQRLEFLNLGFRSISPRTFLVLQTHARNLTELFLCGANLHDNDFIFNDAFPLLKSICLRECSDITFEGIKYLLQSCQSLENVYVDENLAEAWANHPFVITNILGIVKSIENCYYHHKKLLSS